VAAANPSLLVVRLEMLAYIIIHDVLKHFEAQHRTHCHADKNADCAIYACKRPYEKLGRNADNDNPNYHARRDR
jgi:hypothetical protein